MTNSIHFLDENRLLYPVGKHHTLLIQMLFYAGH